jgi:hypothetical protein
MLTGNLMRWSGLAAVVGGILLALAGIATSAPFTGEEEAFSVVASSGAWQVGMGLMLLAMILLLLALVGLYRRQAKQAAGFGLVAFVVAFVGTALGVALMWVFTFVVPTLAQAAPALLDADEPPGLLGVGMFASFILFSLGWLLFGVATLRAGVFPRGAAVLLIIGAVFSFIVDMLPFAVPIPLDLLALAGGLAWMGYQVWADRGRVAMTPEAAVEY